MKIPTTDFYALDDLLTPAEKNLRSKVRTFVEEKYLPIVARHYRDGTFPLELIPEVAALSAFGANIKGYGCPGLGNRAYGLIMQELERGDSGLRTVASVQGALAMNAIYFFGSEAQKKKWLPAMTKGEKLGCFGLTEPTAGSNPAGMVTRAKKTRGGYVLNGAKKWIGNGTVSDVAVVWAKLGGGHSGKDVRGFLVERGTPGFSAKNMEGKLSLRAAYTSELFFKNCELPASALLPKSEGLRSPLQCLNQARFGIAWGVLGAAMASYEEALGYAKSRIQFGRPIAGFQLVQAKLARMVTEITRGQLLAFRLAQLKDEGKITHAQISMAKMSNVEMALDTARTARDILGGVGILDSTHAFRHMCNLESVKTYEGTHDIHLLILGKEITGMEAFE